MDLVPSTRAVAVAAPPAAASKPRLASAPRDAAEAALRVGRYEDARRIADREARGAPGPRADRATLAAARAELALGLAGEARKRLDAAIERRPESLPLRHGLCDVLTEIGDRAAAQPLLDQTYDDWSTGRVDTSKVDDLLAVAAIVRLDDNWQDANDTLRAAVRADPNDPRPNVVWGRLFLEKHAVAEAETSFRAALAIDPDQPDAHVGLATVVLQKRYDIATAERELAAALAINPRHAGALAVRAELALDGEDFAAAAALIVAIRRINPRDAGAAWLDAARAQLLDDDASYAQARDAHAAVHPHDGDFFAAVADVLIRHRRTEDARRIADEGIGVDPQNGRCQSVLATALLRLGDEAAGVEALRRAWQRDPYDARTYNLLELFEKVVPRMQTFKTKHLAFRIDASARAAVELVVAPFLEATYDRAVVKYGFAPRGPITFELYEKPEHYAIRTVGMPGLGVDAVCFGRVITSQSPTNGAMNWGMVLAHELAHVFAIELSRSRVPRWFTEGLSELETMRARPEWRRHADRDLWGAAYRGELASLASLSNAFVRARDADESSRAYAEAAAALDYIDRRFGFAAILNALARFGRGERGIDVVAAAAGVSAGDLERGFRSDLAHRQTIFDQQYLPSETLRVSRDAAEAALRALPASTTMATSAASAARAGAEARLGLAQLRDGDTVAAARTLLRARAAIAGSRSQPPLASDDARAVEFLAGEIALALRQADDARSAFTRLLSAPVAAPDGYDLRVRLALAEIHRRDLPAAEEHIRRAMTFDPESAEATGLLVELLGDPDWHGSREDDRLRAIASTLRLEPLHANLATELVFGLGRRGRAVEVSEMAPIAIFIEPGTSALHAALGRALAALGRLRPAVSALDLALALGPASDEDAAEVRRLLAELHRKLGDPGSAAAPATATARGGSAPSTKP